LTLSCGSALSGKTAKYLMGDAADVFEWQVLYKMFSMLAK